MKNMKLELQHIVSYLPYKLKLINGEFVTEMCASLRYIYDNYHHEFTMIDELFNGGKTWIKPILRPLSDLSKEIEHNVEKFIPLEYLTKLCDLNIDMYELRFENLLFVLYNKKEGFYQINDNNFSFFQKLYEWHFDIYKLIEENLAVDINTLKK